MAFIEQMRARRFAVESVCQVLREQGVQVAARTYRAWKQPGRPVAARTIADAVVIDALRQARGTPDGRPTPESLYGRRKMTALLRRRGLQVAHCTVDRLMRELGMQGMRRGKTPRTTIPSTSGTRAADLLERDFTAPAPNRTWIADFTYVRTWAAMVYVAFVVDKGGSVFENSGDPLPSVDGAGNPITYREWDVNPYVKGVDRGPERLVTGSDGSAYYTGDHYSSFLQFWGLGL